MGVNQLQTAVTYDALLAQDRGRRILRPDLVTPDPSEPPNEGRAIHKAVPEWLRSFVGANALRVMALGALVAVAAPLSAARAEPPPLAGSPEAWLEGAERILRANTGRLLVLVSGAGATTVYAVIHARLRRFGSLTPRRLPPRLAWGYPDGWSAPRVHHDHLERWLAQHAGLARCLPDLALVAGSSAGMHPLAAFHDRLLANSLAGAFFGLPQAAGLGLAVWYTCPVRSLPARRANLSRSGTALAIILSLPMPTALGICADGAASMRR